MVTTTIRIWLRSNILEKTLAKSKDDASNGWRDAHHKRNLTEEEFCHGDAMAELLLLRESIKEVLRKHHTTFTVKALEVKGIEQKKRMHLEERQKAIAKEIEKLQAAGFIKEVKYLEWLADVVLVTKANRKFHMRVDFTDLNKAYPQRLFSIPQYRLTSG
ncbi:uncharacterized protein LOC126657186 [Mercurialis annua]|uniref:uncharacterized protein LOC126657186 n=1 Tax=Mercurialis annua TaxID=3986 RepID=UPI0021601761|nr:uncharacterized protein LOC126657186 [Mercurialis annua]